MLRVRAWRWGILLASAAAFSALFSGALSKTLERAAAEEMPVIYAGAQLVPEAGKPAPAVAGLHD
jgi:hypothetical protein